MEKISDLLPDTDSTGTRNKTKQPNVDDKWAQSPEDVNGSFQEGDFGKGCFNSERGPSDDTHDVRSFSADPDANELSCLDDAGELS